MPVTSTVNGPQLPAYHWTQPLRPTVQPRPTSSSRKPTVTNASKGGKIFQPLRYSSPTVVYDVATTKYVLEFVNQTTGQVRSESSVTSADASNVYEKTQQMAVPTSST